MPPITLPAEQGLALGASAPSLGHGPLQPDPDLLAHHMSQLIPERRR